MRKAGHSIKQKYGGGFAGSLEILGLVKRTGRASNELVE
jgi:hypothetical protein